MIMLVPISKGVGLTSGALLWLGCSDISECCLHRHSVFAVHG